MAIFIFSYPDTATEPIDFEILLKRTVTLDNLVSKEVIGQLNSNRSKMASLLLSQPNSKAILDILDNYIPDLIQLIPYIEHNGLQNIFSTSNHISLLFNLLEIKWRSSLSASVRTNISGNFEKPFIKSYSIYYELIYAHMTYAFILCNMAAKKVTPDSSEEDLNLAINNLCRAAGIFQNLSISYATAWAIQDGPPETTSDSLKALTELALGDAQQVAYLKAERKKLSSSALSKLKAGIIVKYLKCDKIIHQTQQEYEDFSRSFKLHVSLVRKFLEATFLLSLAKSHADNNEYGTAVAEITGAHNYLLDCCDSDNSLIKTSARNLMEETENLHSNYTKMNNNFSYQRVPALDAIREEYQLCCRVIVDPKPVHFGNSK